MKKFLALILAVVMMAAMAVPAFAETYNTAGEQGMTVTYSVAPSYTVTIPANITIGAGGTATETISAAGVIVEKGECVSVSLADDNNFTVKTPQGAELTYTVKVNGTAIGAGEEILTIDPTNAADGSAEILFSIDESTIQYAGTYTGSATFTVSVVKL